MVTRSRKPASCIMIAADIFILLTCAASKYEPFPRAAHAPLLVDAWKPVPVGTSQP